MSKVKSIIDIVMQDMCCSCNACAVVCPKQAISYSFNNGQYLPQVDTSKCVDCGQCLRICPSDSMDDKTIYGTLDLDKTPDSHCYSGYALDEHIRHISASGGVTTAIVRNLLQLGEYQQAFLLEYETGVGKAMLRAFFAEDDICKSVKSKYIPASIENVAQSIKDGTIEHSIVVCTPCQLLAIKKLLQVYKRDEGTILFIGLFCDRTLNYNVFKYFQYRFGCYDWLHFRDKDAGGWPGNTMLKQGTNLLPIDREVRMSLKPYFQLNRCRFCFDKLNQLADISVGDCYIEGKEDPLGISNMIVRTSKGKKAFACVQSELYVEPTMFETIAKSQVLENSRSRMLLNRQTPLTKRMLLGKNMKKSDYRKIQSDINVRPSKYMRRMKRLINGLIHLVYRPNKRQYVLIDNIGFINKGAELMLCSIVQFIEKNFANAQMVVHNDVFYQNPSYCIKHYILPMKCKNGNSIKGRVLRYLYWNVLGKIPYITPNMIDLILDAGGFQFSDQWLPTKESIARTKWYYNLFTKYGRRIIFLPQAFGPFDHPLSQELMRYIYGIADVIYARENISYSHIFSLLSKCDKVRVASDFTCICHLEADTPTIYLPYKSYVVICPNARMVTHTTEGNAYVPFLLSIIRMLQELGEQIVLLNHGGVDDQEFLTEINSSFSNSLVCISNLDALNTKYIIGNSKMLISSRFHGVVNGLTQFVKTFCTSWSHKYQLLLKDFHCEENILSIQDEGGTMQKIKAALVNPTSYIPSPTIVHMYEKNIHHMWMDLENVFK